ncbi:major facilitator transporter [Streptomyces rimosus subsp. pseudoverticillatus]|uniref:MFS transporter n=1 Tax=Streptomyces rimosus TaxID=1927 RepID=UPI0006B29700|nr:MFS transporter [Streptomyces rimosus]KOT90106.1 major facilitator transporter [Streptomyces rimosus subsp. pseudoverticillatus]
MLTQTERKTPHRWATLAVLCASLLMVGMDLTVLHVAVPTISKRLLPNGSQLLWIVDGYALTVAAGLITCGTLGDRYGRKRLLLAGFLVFGLASAGAALSVSPLQLIIARAALGFGGAMIMAGTPAILKATFTDPRERTLAVGLWTAANSVGVSVGPLLGGLLVKQFWWGSVFLVNLPIAAAALVGAAFLVPESKNPRPSRWDAGGAALSALGLALTVYALQQLGEDPGAQLLTWLVAVAGVGLLVAFVRRQRRISSPLLDVSLFTDRTFSFAALGILGCYGAYTTLLFLLTQRFQLVDAYSPLHAGLALVPLALTNAIGAALAPRFSARFGYHRGLSGGLLLTALAFAAFSVFGTADNYVALVAAGLGAGAVMALASDAILGAAPTERAGEAGAVQETSFSLGAGLGPAFLGTALSLAYRSSFPSVPQATERQVETARQSLGAASDIAEKAGGRTGKALLDSARHAFETGFTVATAVAAVSLTLFAALSAVQLRSFSKGVE